MEQAIPPPPPIESDEDIYFFGFPLEDIVQFYRNIVDPHWTPARPGGQPWVFTAIAEISRRLGAHGPRVTWADVVAADDPDHVLHMVAVASATKANPESSKQYSREELERVAEAACLEGVEPRWLCGLWPVDDWKEMKYPSEWV